MSKLGISFKNLLEDIKTISKQSIDLLFEANSEVNKPVSLNIENHMERLERGLDEIVACLENQPTWLTTWQNKELMQELANAANCHLWIEKKEESDTPDERSLGEILGISQESLDTIYAIAYHFYEDKEFIKSSDVFWVLCTFEPLMHIGWFGLGLSEQQRERWELAVEAYTIASVTDSKTPIPYFNAAECYEALNDFPKAIESLDLAIGIIDQTKDKNFESVKQEAIQKKMRIRKV